MIRVLHLIDDAGMGGVTRVLRDHLPRLGGAYRHEVRCVDARWRLPKATDAEVVIVHFTLNWAKLPYLAALRARLRHKRLVLVEHSYTEAYERLQVRRQGRFRTMLRLAYGMADRVVAVSHAQAAWLRQARLVSAARLVAIPQACDTSQLLGLQPATATTLPLRLGAYGRYVSQKGFDVLIEAMRRIPASMATLELVGQGPDLALLQAIAEGTPSVSIRGPVDGPAEFLPRVDVVVIPSRWEAFGLVAAEARAAGRPILAARTDGLIEQIDPSYGILFAPEDPGQLAIAIRSLAGRDLRVMGEAARRSIGIALDATISRWTELLDELAPTQLRRARASEAMAAFTGTR